MAAQYCAHDYQKLVKQFGMQPSMSRKGNCYDNTPMESFWDSLNFVMTSNSAEFLYKTTDYWVRELERSIPRDDPAIGIDWSLEAELLLSCKDKAGTLPDDADVFALRRTPAWRDVFSTPMFQLRKRQRHPRRSG